MVAEHQDLLNASKCPFVAGLFPPLPAESSKSSKFSSIGSRFKVNYVHSILDNVNVTMSVEHQLGFKFCFALVFPLKFYVWFYLCFDLVFPLNF